MPQAGVPAVLYGFGADGVTPAPVAAGYDGSGRVSLATTDGAVTALLVQILAELQTHTALLQANNASMLAMTGGR